MKSRAALRAKQMQPKVEVDPRFDEDEEFTHELGSIDNYNVSTRLGRGKYSNVFRGHTLEGDLRVIKVLKPVRFSKINREIRILEILKDGPYISQLCDVVQDEDSKSIALVLNWSDNVNIRSTFPQLSTQDIAIYTYKVLCALQYAHSKGIMHRDIKPGNIMYSPETNNVSVIDWGLAEFFVPGKSYTVRVATRHYKGPELLMGNQQYDFSLDIWCLGCTMAALLFQKNPFFRGGDNDDQILKMGEVLGGAALIQYAEKYYLKEKLSSKVKMGLHNCKPKPWATWITKHNKKIVTTDALDLLSKMLTVDHAFRPTATEALSHPFFDQIKGIV